MLLCLFQQMLGTTAVFSLCSFLFTMIAAVAFNVAGGFTKPAGGFVFGYAAFGVVVGLVYKVVVGEAGQKNLLQPARTMEVFVGGSIAMLLAALLERRFAANRSLLDRLPFEQEMTRTATACMIIGWAYLLQAVFGASAEAGSILALLRQLNVFLPLAILLGVTAQIRQSGGRRSINVTVLLAMAGVFMGGLYSFSKEGLYTALACWVLAAAAQRYKVSVLQIGGLLVATMLINYYLVPYSQYGRSLVTDADTLSQRLEINVFLLAHLDQTRKAYLESSVKNLEETSDVHYYDNPAGLFDRLQMIAPDDLLVDITENGALFGYLPTLIDFENVIPHIILPNKPPANFGNIYAHEVGLVAEEDVTTGISFTPSGDAYHQGKWVAVLMLLPTLLFILFWLSNAISGDLTKSPFGLVVLVSFLHVAPEGGIGGVIGSAFTGSIVISALALVVTRLIPLLTNVMLGPAKRPIGQQTITSAMPGLQSPLRIARETAE